MPRRSTSNTLRFFVAPGTLRGAEARIADGALAHQIGHVLRLRPADEITLLDNSGWEHMIRIESIERHAVTGMIVARQLAAGEPRLRLALYVALLRGERFEWVLQKGTELGASIFAPITCERSMVDAKEISAAKMERWERIIREAAEQSRRGRLPQLQPAQPFGSACADATRRAPALLLWEGSGGTSLRRILQEQLPRPGEHGPPSLAVFSGPEGGWTEGEVATALKNNVQLASLGPRTLRAETAPIAAAAAIFYEHGDLD